MMVVYNSLPKIGTLINLNPIAINGNLQMLFS